MGTHDMASSSSSFTLTNLQQQQQQLFPLLCKYSSALNAFAFQFPCSTHFPIFSSPKRTHDLSPFPLLVGDQFSHTVPKLSATDHEPSTKTLNFEIRKQNGYGFSSSRSKDERVDRKSMEIHRAAKSMENKGSLAFDEEIEKITKKRGSDTNQEGEKNRKIRKGSKKNKVDSPKVQFKARLDMCSKRGDVMGAIEFYDVAQREGIKLKQYHYAVILYLCSSAAVGVVRPAKSGSGARTLNANLSNDVSSSNFKQFVGAGRSHENTDNLKLFSNGSTSNQKEGYDDSSHGKDGSGSQEEDNKICISEDVKRYALERGFEIYEKMCLDKVPMNEAILTSLARMAMSIGNGDMALDMVNQMKSLGIHPRLRSYGPALLVFCNSGDVDKAFAVEEHMLEHGVYPEEPELEALLRVSVGAGRGDKVYYLLHKLRASVRKVSSSTVDLIVKWFKSRAAARVGKRKLDERLIKEAIENGGGGWHGLGWLGKGKWTVSDTVVVADGFCKCCGEKLAAIDLDPVETENFSESVASIAIKRDKNSSFQKFQKWLDYFGPFEAVVDGANVGLFGQKRFISSRINALVNGIRQQLPSKEWPLIILHNKHITGRKMDEPKRRAFVEKWKNAKMLYATPTGSNDDWYWLYAAIKFKCLIVTNDEMRDHNFQLLGNDFFPKWKERHQARFSFPDSGPVFHMPPVCSIVIQESEKGHWHIPIVSEHDCEENRKWLCITRGNSCALRKSSSTKLEESQPLRHNKGHGRPATQAEAKKNHNQ